MTDLFEQVCEVVKRENAKVLAEPCPHLRRAVADKLLVLARIEFEPSPRIQYALKLAVQEFEKQIEAHRNCRCQELRESA